MKITIQFSTDGERGVADVFATYSDGVSRMLINDKVGKLDRCHREDLGLRFGDFMKWLGERMTEYYNLAERSNGNQKL